MKRNSYRFAATVVVIVWIASTLSGCNMVKGLGQDITGAAESTERFFTGEPTVQANHRPAEPEYRSFDR
ncbi:MAG: hypothetical protein O7G85_05950 [Planctomycetota bacterium]|nr:hypothetical protein [Planctomycetota bacterium]